VRYYVISSDGQRYGPADIETLNQWVAEGRLLPHQMVENEDTGERQTASSVEGLNFQAAAAPIVDAYAPGQQYQQHYYRPNTFDATSQKDVTTAWVLGAFGILCCGCIGIFTSIFGLQAANRAIAKGNPAGNAPRTFNIVVLVLNVIWIPINIAVVLPGVMQGMR
jgi:hypothetical protein